MLPDISARIARTIATGIGARTDHVAAAIALLDGGATVPFVARCHKEATGGLDDTQLRNLDDRLGYLREIEARRRSVLGSIRQEGKLVEVTRALKRLHFPALNDRFDFTRNELIKLGNRAATEITDEGAALVQGQLRSTAKGHRRAAGSRQCYG